MSMLTTVVGEVADHTLLPPLHSGRSLLPLRGALPAVAHGFLARSAGYHLPLTRHHLATPAPISHGFLSRGRFEVLWYLNENGRGAVTTGSRYQLAILTLLLDSSTTIYNHLIS